MAKSSENIALHKNVSQSSTYSSDTHNYDATKAVDGNYDQNYMSCAHGDKRDNTLNWFMVDLSEIYYVSEVILTPRKDSGIICFFF